MFYIELTLQLGSVGSSKKDFFQRAVGYPLSCQAVVAQ